MKTIKRLKISDIVEWIYIISLVGLFLKSFNFKFFFEIPESLFLTFSLVAWMFCSLLNKIRLETNDYLNMIIISAIIILQVLSNRIEGIAGQTLLLVNVLGLMTSTAEIKHKLLDSIIKVFAVICLISLIGWVVVYVFNIRLHMEIVTFGDYRFYDYGFFNTRVEGIEFTRYLGMFIEPGYTGVMCVLLMVSNRFEEKDKYNFILLMCAIATLSLAAYILIAYYILISQRSFKKIRAIIVGIIIVAIALLFIHNYIYDLSWVYEYFIQRRINDLLTNKITGNRFSNSFNDFFKNYILKDPFSFIFGVGSVRYIELAKQLYFKSAGILVYIAQFGMMNTVLVFLFYYRMIREYSNKSESMHAYILWILSIIDMAYPTWSCFLIYAICFAPHREWVDKRGNI